MLSNPIIISPSLDWRIIGLPMWVISYLDSFPRVFWSFNFCVGLVGMDPPTPRPYEISFTWCITHGSFQPCWCDLLRMVDLELWYPMWSMSEREYGCERGLFYPSLTKILGAFSIYVSEVQGLSRWCRRWHLVILNNGKTPDLLDMYESNKILI